jgi:hypothetical protein
VPSGPASADALYKVPLREFTAERDALARSLKSAGDAAASAGVKRRGKPTPPAWAANQVVWRAPQEWSRLRAAAAALRAQHARPSSVQELRGLVHEQREALRACEARAAEMLERHGHAASADVLQRVSGTLLALAHGMPGAEPGRVTRELQPPGFEVLAGLTLALAPEPSADERPAAGQAGPASGSPAVSGAPPSGRTRRSEAERRRERQERARRKAALQSARARVAAARQTLSTAQARLSGDEERCRRLERDLTAARVAMDRARGQVNEAEAEEAAAEAALSAAGQQAGD